MGPFSTPVNHMSHFWEPCTTTTEGGRKEFHSFVIYDMTRPCMGWDVGGREGGDLSACMHAFLIPVIAREGFHVVSRKNAQELHSGVGARFRFWGCPKLSLHICEHPQWQKRGRGSQ